MTNVSRFNTALNDGIGTRGVDYLLLLLMRAQHEVLLNFCSCGFGEDVPEVQFLV